MLVVCCYQIPTCSEHNLCITSGLSLAVVYGLSGNRMDDMAWGVFFVLSLPVALYNVSSGVAPNPFEHQPYQIFEWLSVIVRVFCACLVVHRLLDFYRAVEVSRHMLHNIC